MMHNRFWTMATDALPPQDATTLAEDLGIEFDTDEHIAVERGPLCPLPNLKRKRVWRGGCNCQTFVSVCAWSRVLFAIIIPLSLFLCLMIIIVRLSRSPLRYMLERPLRLIARICTSPCNFQIYRTSLSLNLIDQFVIFATLQVSGALKTLNDSYFILTSHSDGQFCKPTSNESLLTLMASNPHSSMSGRCLSCSHSWIWHPCN